MATESTSKRPVLYLAEFETADAVVHAAEKVRDEGFERWDVHTPYPVHGMDSAMGLSDSRLGWIVLLCGLTGVSCAILMIQWMNGFDYPLANERDAWRALPAEERAGSQWQQFKLTQVNSGTESRLATDDWPMLYLREPMIPGVSLRGGAIMAAIAALLLVPFLRRGAAPSAQPAGLLVQMFFLGAGFMLVETKAVVHMALLFGGTWIVNSVVIFAVLVMILVANFFVAIGKPRRLAVHYAALLASLVVSALVPMDTFLGMDRAAQIAAASALAFTPIFFAGVIFAVSFTTAVEPDRAFGANIAGAMFGGLAEYSSMLLGFQYLLFVAVALYIISIAGYQKAVTGMPAAHIGQEPAA